jgi:hypothetical protein
MARWRCSADQMPRSRRLKTNLAMDFVMTSCKRINSRHHTTKSKGFLTYESHALTWVIVLSSAHISRSSASSRTKYGPPSMDIQFRVGPLHSERSGVARARSPLPPEREGWTMYSLNDPLGGSEGPTSSVTPTPDLGAASGVSGMAHRRSENVGDATPVQYRPLPPPPLKRWGWPPSVAPGVQGPPRQRWCRAQPVPRERAGQPQCPSGWSPGQSGG